MTDPNEPRPQVDERVERLRERASRDFPESWVPDNAGDEIVGELVRYERGTTAYGKQVIAVLRTPEGTERSVWLLHSVLRGEFAEQRPQVGELVLVRYDGRKQSERGQAFESYRVVVDRSNVSPDWEALEADARSQAPTSAPSTPSVHEPLEPRQPRRQTDDEVPF